MSKPSRKCIFCGKEGMSKAHLLPAWLNDELLPEERTTYYLEHTGYFETFTATVKSPPPRTRVRQGSSGNRKIRKVCKRCNSGWMGNFETPVRPHVVALMNGQNHALDPNGQTLLAAWLTLIATLFDALAPEQSAVPQSDRDYLRTRNVPPPEWKIWVAKYDGPDWLKHRARRLGMRVQEKSTPVGEGNSCNTQVTTLVLR